MTPKQREALLETIAVLNDKVRARGDHDPETEGAVLAAIAVLRRGNDHPQLVVDLAKDGDTIANEINGYDAHLIHMILGVAGEVGELLDAIKKAVIYRKDLDRTHVIEEMGDIEFYMEGLRQGLEIDRDEVLSANVSKLRKRYPGGGYTDADAKVRADKS